jgi:peroxiredoxin
MLRKITFLLLLALQLTGSLIYAGAPKKGFDYKFKIKGLENQLLVLAFRYGDNQYVKDTIHLDKTGFGEYKGDSSLPPGIYLGVVPSMNNTWFEFVVKEPSFMLETDKGDLNKNMKVTGSNENKIFFDDLFYIAKQREIADPLSAQLKGLDQSSDSAKAIKDKLNQIDKDVKAYREKMMQEHPDMLYSKIMKALKEVEVPDPPKDKNGVVLDSNFQYHYYKSHYWDNVDFKEEGLLRSPVYAQKLETFFEKVIIQVPDSLIPAAHFVLEKSKANPEMFKYTLVTLINKYANSKIMGMDAVYVDLAKNYYLTGQAVWMKNDTASMYRMKDRVEVLSPLLIGKKAPNLILQDTSLQRVYELHAVNAKYTILVFWDPDCGHCKKEIPALAKNYDKLKSLGAAVYSVTTATYEEMDKWKGFIKDHGLNWINVGDPYFQGNPNFRKTYDISSTPVIYVLDQDKIIRAKRLGQDQIEDFIVKYEEYLKSKNK